jgi:hypothetical protein
MDYFGQLGFVTFYESYMYFAGQSSVMNYGITNVSDGLFYDILSS